MKKRGTGFVDLWIGKDIVERRSVFQFEDNDEFACEGTVRTCGYHAFNSLKGGDHLVIYVLIDGGKSVGSY